MPYAEEMNWHEGRKCWRRMFMGAKYEISARALKCEPTKEASRAAANAWWKQKEAEFYASQGSPVERAVEAITLAQRLDFDSRTISDHVLPFLPSLGLPEPVKRLLTTSLLNLGAFKETHGDEVPLLPQIGDMKPVFTVASGVADFIVALKNRHQNGKLSPQSVENYARCIREFEEWIGKDTDMASISEETVIKFHAYLTNRKGAKQSKGQIFTVFKTAVTQWANAKKCVKPMNLEGRQWAFGKDKAKKDYWSPELFREEYAKADDVGKLILCLAANTGSYGCDMANLEWLGGETIEGQERVKTGQGDDSAFHLWPETQQLLAKVGHVLKGRWKKELAGEKVKKDTFITRQAQKFSKQVKWLRHTSAQFLNKVAEHKPYAEYFLRHASGKMSELFYLSPVRHKAMFDYLHDCYFGK